jgi:hypothetical protein
VKNGEVKLEVELEAGGCGLEWRDEVREGEQGWYRLEAWDGQGQLLVITNPIYFGARREPERRYFGDFVSGAE